MLEVIYISSTKTCYLKFIYSEKATKILRNLPLTFDYSTYSQKLVEDFAKFCGLLRIYELYWTGDSKNNMLSYCGLVDAKIRASCNHLPVGRLNEKECSSRKDFNSM